MTTTTTILIERRSLDQELGNYYQGNIIKN